MNTYIGVGSHRFPPKSTFPFTASKKIWICVNCSPKIVRATVARASNVRLEIVRIRKLFVHTLFVYSHNIK